MWISEGSVLTTLYSGPTAWRWSDWRAPRSQSSHWTTNSCSLVRKTCTFPNDWRCTFLCPSSQPSIVATESILTSCFSVWCGNCHASDHRTLHRVKLALDYRLLSPLLYIKYIKLLSICKTTTIEVKSSHPSYGLFQLGEGSVLSRAGLSGWAIVSSPN